MGASAGIVRGAWVFDGEVRQPPTRGEWSKITICWTTEVWADFDLRAHGFLPDVPLELPSFDNRLSDVPAAIAAAEPARPVDAAPVICDSDADDEVPICGLIGYSGPLPPSSTSQPPVIIIDNDHDRSRSPRQGLTQYVHACRCADSLSGGCWLGLG